MSELNGKLIEGKKESLSWTEIMEKAGKAVVMVVCY
jgi:cyanate lyase